MVEEKLINWQPLIRACKSLNWPWRLLAGVSILGIIVELGYFAFYAIPWPKFGVAEWAYWVAAIGTTGTLIGTLWIATSENRRRRNDASAVARLTAAAMYFQHLHNQANANFALHCLKVANNHELLALKGMEHILILTKNAHRLLAKVNQWTPTELLRLAPLHGDCAAQLAAAHGRIGSTMSLLSDIEESSQNQASFFEHLSTNCTVLESAVQQLQSTSRIFETVIDNS
ncbi:hypothetical protein AKG95_15565 [Janthinobacterium lividum]|uniref:Uncharacterized protein n=1 Tax=Janthinobacterium lividum TaxID=29581 RepID=A0A1S1U6V4_9BURK|nr:hypothetical protein [Janthinobacterium lividum]OHV96212.1 hypothetical protein AKG95_15565 [Janthinobacterium lividum]